MRYTIHDAGGKAVRIVECPEDHAILQLREGETMTEGAEVVYQFVPPPSSHRDLRVIAYPTIGDQLDALWHAMAEGVIPKVDAFFDPIEAVKRQFPKE